MRKTHASIHAAPVRAAPARGCVVPTSAHAAPVPTSAHAAVVPTSEAAAMAATATATASERRCRKSKRRSKRTRDEVTKELLVHRNSSLVESQRRITSQKRTTSTPKGCNDFK